MNWEAIRSDIWEAARAVYGIGLLVLGLAAMVVLPAVLRVLREFTVALKGTSAALHAIAADRTAERDQLGRIEAAVSRIEAKVTEPRK